MPAGRQLLCEARPACGRAHRVTQRSAQWAESRRRPGQDEHHALEAELMAQGVEALRLFVGRSTRELNHF
eukprot:1614800-Prymnesium_polylepis.1